MLLSTFAFGLTSLALSSGVAAQGGRAYADFQAPYEPDNEAVAANFPDIEDVELLSPSFLNPENIPEGFANGSATPLSQVDQDHFLRKIASRHDWISYRSDFTSEEGRAMPYLYLSNDKETGSKPNEKVRIFIQGHMHGNEPAGEEAVLALLGKFDANETWAESILDSVNIAILPRYNPDGAAYMQRQLATGYDPNRDFMVLQRQQTRDIKQLHVKFDPHIFVDAHEYTASTLLGPDSNLLKSEDGQLGHPKNLNVHKDVRSIEKDMFIDGLTAEMQRRKLRTGAYFTVDAGSELELEESSSSSRYSDHSLVLSQCVAILTETRGIRLGDQYFQRRTATGFILLDKIIQIAADNAEHIYKTIENAREEFAESTEDIVVTDHPRETNITWDFIDANNGSIVTMPVTFLNHTPPVVDISRSRPEAYVFSRAWADVAERLRVMGVEVEELKQDFRGTVEALTVGPIELAKTRFEGIAETTVKSTKTGKRDVVIPAGGFWVSTRQKKAAYALVFLEPENVASVAAYNIVPVEEGDEFPIFRVPRQT